MTDEKLLKVGIIGAIVAALCCVTPILVILVTTIGLSAIIGWLDFVLFPALAAFIFNGDFGPETGRSDDIFRGRS